MPTTTTTTADLTMTVPGRALSWHSIHNRLLRYGKRLRLLWPSSKSSKLHCGLTVLIAVLFSFLLTTIWLVLVSGPKPASVVVAPYFDRHSGHHYSQPSSSVSTDSESVGHGTTDQAILDLVKLGMIYNESDRTAKQEGFQKHSFNTLVSERIGLRRVLPDTRHPRCLNQSYPNVPLDTTVIVCFYNEHFETLLRTIYSLLEQTQSDQLREIILVDDHSDNNVGNQLDQHRQSLAAAGLSNNKTYQPGSAVHNLYLDKVHYYRTPERAGLIRARLYGAQFARARVLFFVDSHCEMNRDWLPPLLDRINFDRKLVVCPIIDLIDPDTFQYSASPIVKGGFQWGLHFKWDSVPSELLQTDSDFVRPIKSPAMAGGLFAIEKDYFYELGGYDRGMDIWGGENIEISLRIWMCGGRLEIIPCSRVGHVFRRRRPYGSPDGTDTLAYNSVRAARVWMDHYLKYFLDTRSDLASMPYGNIDQQTQLRARLNCSTFEWYLRNVYPELLTPDQLKQQMALKANLKSVNVFGRKQPKVLHKFRLQLSIADFSHKPLCLESDSEVAYKGGTLSLKPCSGKQVRRQIWKQSELHDLRLGSKSCLEALQSKQSVKMGKCHEMGGTQHWQYHSKNHTLLYNVGSGLCLAAFTTKKVYSLGEISALSLAMTFCKDETPVGTGSSFYHFTRWNLISS